MGLLKTKEERWLETAAKAREGKGLVSILNQVKPLRTFMRTWLARVGQSTTPNISTFDLVLLFGKYVLSGKARENAIEILDIVGEKRLEGRNIQSELIVGEIAPAVLAGIASIITAISSFFAAMKEKKEKGELNANEAAIVDQAEKVIQAGQTGLGTTAVGYGASGLPAFLFSQTGILLIGAAIAAGFLLKRP